jgi:hypothetical protein
MMASAAPAAPAPASSSAAVPPTPPGHTAPEASASEPCFAPSSGLHLLNVLELISTNLPAANSDADPTGSLGRVSYQPSGSCICVGKGVAFWAWASAALRGEPLPWHLSGDWIHWLGLDIIGKLAGKTLAQAEGNRGISLEAGIAAIAAGACRLSAWPSDPHFDHPDPPPDAYDHRNDYRLTHPVVQVTSRDPATIKQILSLGIPLLTGLPNYASSWKVMRETGTMPLPEDGEQPDGGHCFVFVGYRRARPGYITAFNSVKDMGDQLGYTEVDEGWLSKADELWAIVPMLTAA